MRVCVIGCGPAGLAAVHAAFGFKADITLIAPIVKTPQLGPLVLQHPIPGITADHPTGYIRQIVIGGSILDYRYRLYGDVNINIQGDVLRHGYHAWDHRKTYNDLWDQYIMKPGIHVQDREVMPVELASMPDRFDLVVSTAPLHKMCMRPANHHFEAKRIAITEETCYPDQPDDTTIFNAGDEYPWIRSARLLGIESTEWFIEDAPGYARIIKKPISTNCNCFPRVLLTGRFGAWRNETWVHTAYYDTRDAIVSAQRQPIWDQVK